MMSFAAILKKFMTDESLTQEAFASKVGVKQSQVSGWLLGKCNPSYEMIKAIVKAFDAPAEFWLGLVSEY